MKTAGIGVLIGMALAATFSWAAGRADVNLGMKPELFNRLSYEAKAAYALGYLDGINLSAFVLKSDSMLNWLNSCESAAPSKSLPGFLLQDNAEWNDRYVGPLGLGWYVALERLCGPFLNPQKS